MLLWIGSGTYAGTSSTGTVAPLASPGMRQLPASATVANFKVRSFWQHAVLITFLVTVTVHPSAVLCLCHPSWGLLEALCFWPVHPSVHAQWRHSYQLAGDFLCIKYFCELYLALCWSVTSCRLHWLHPYGKLIGVSGMCLAVNRLFGCMSVRPSFIPSLMHIFGRVLQMTHHVAAPCTNVVSVDFTPTVQGPIHIFLFLKLLLKCPFTILLQNLHSTISCAYCSEVCF